MPSQRRELIIYDDRDVKALGWQGRSWVRIAGGSADSDQLFPSR
jgi:hypothetical protein